MVVPTVVLVVTTAPDLGVGGVTAAVLDVLLLWMQTTMHAQRRRAVADPMVLPIMTAVVPVCVERERECR